MKNMVAELQKIIPVPDSPIDTDESVLVKNSKQLNVEFPSDFLEFVLIYGSGEIVAEETYGWEIISPARPTYTEFVNEFYDRKTVNRELGHTDDLPLGLFPEDGGLLPFGGIDDTYFTWKTVSNPDEW